MPASKWPAIGAGRDADCIVVRKAGLPRLERRELRPYIVRSWSRPPRGDAVSASSHGDIASVVSFRHQRDASEPEPGQVPRAGQLRRF